MSFAPSARRDERVRRAEASEREHGTRRRVLFNAFRQAVNLGKRDIRAPRDALPGCGVDFLPYRDMEFFEHASRLAYFD